MIVDAPSTVVSDEEPGVIGRAIRKRIAGAVCGFFDESITPESGFRVTLHENRDLLEKHL